MSADLDGDVEYLDPTAETDTVQRAHAPRNGELAGPVALVDISKPQGDIFLDEIERLLEARGIEVRRFRKPTFTKPAPEDLITETAEKCGAAIFALAD